MINNKRNSFKKRPGRDRDSGEFDEKVIQVSRVSKKTKGGNQIGFSVVMVVGDKKGQVGVGLGKAPDVISAIRKGIKRAKKKLINVPIDGTTVPFGIVVKKGAARIMLKPAAKGSGIIAGGPVRSVVEAAGIRDISSKILGTTNKASNVYATFEALRQIKQLVKIKGVKLRSLSDVEAEESQKEKELQQKAKETGKQLDKREAKKTILSKKVTFGKPKKVVKKKIRTKK